MNRRDDRDLVSGQRTKQAPNGNVLARSGLRHRLEEIAKVVAGGEVFALSLQADQADRIVVGGAFDRVGQRRIHGDGDGISALGPGQGDG